MAKSTDVAASLESKTHVHEKAHGLRGEMQLMHLQTCTMGGKWFFFWNGANAALVFSDIVKSRAKTSSKTASLDKSNRMTIGFEVTAVMRSLSHLQEKWAEKKHS